MDEHITVGSVAGWGRVGGQDAFSIDQNMVRITGMAAAGVFAGLAGGVARKAVIVCITEETVLQIAWGQAVAADKIEAWGTSKTIINVGAFASGA